MFGWFKKDPFAESLGEMVAEKYEKQLEERLANFNNNLTEKNNEIEQLKKEVDRFVSLLEAKDKNIESLKKQVNEYYRDYRNELGRLEEYKNSSFRKSECFELAIKSGAGSNRTLELAQKLHEWIFSENKID